MLLFESILFLTPIEVSIVFLCSRGSIENWLEPKAKPLLGNLAYPNP